MPRSPDRWRVIYTDELLAKAKDRFPVGGSPDGRASYELFREGPLEAAALQYGRELDALPVESGFHIAQTVPTPLFEPVAFYASLLEHDGVVTIEIVDFEIDDDYWELVENDAVD